MKKIWHIYKTDLTNIIKVPTGLLLMVALAVLPSVYAWVNLKAMWDPYTHTGGIKVAVTSKDEGATVQNRTIRIGDEILKSLRSNQQLGWTFVDENEAARGVLHGDYYASLLIPADFSAKIASFVSGVVQKPAIYYSVNEKVNAIAPKITEKGASNISAQINRNFIEAVSEAVFAELKRLGMEITRQLPTIRRMESFVFELESRLPVIEEVGVKTIELERKLPEIQAKSEKIMELEQLVPEMTRVGNTVLALEERWPQVTQAAQAAIAVLEPLPDISQAADGIQRLDARFAEAEGALIQAIDTADRAREWTASLLEDLNRAESLANNYGTVSTQRSRLSQDVQQAQAGIQLAEAQLYTLRDELSQYRLQLHGAASHIQGDAEALADLENRLPAILRSDLKAIGDKLTIAADFVRDELPAVEEDIHRLTNLYQAKFGMAEDAVHRAADFARHDLPQFEQAVRKAANEIRQAQGNERINELVKLMHSDLKEESEFLANPVTIKEDKKFPIPNYGSAMSPFYTTLALWVGAMLLVSLLKTEVDDPGGQYRNYHVYFGRMMTFLTIGMFQALIVTFGDMYILGTYVVNKAAFPLFAVLISIVFVTLTYTMVSLFGDVGKGLAIIFLVLQFSSSGGTFPVSTSGPFFQALNPFMPFTYGVSVLRESVGGMVADIVLKDISVLCLFVAICCVLAPVLKKPLGGLTQRLAKQAKKTKLIH